MQLDRIKKQNAWTEKYLDLCDTVQHYEDLILEGKFWADSLVTMYMMDQQDHLRKLSEVR